MGESALRGIELTHVQCRQHQCQYPRWYTRLRRNARTRRVVVRLSEARSNDRLLPRTVPHRETGTGRTAFGRGKSSNATAVSHGMKLLLDENLPHQLRHEIPGHECYTVAYMGWGGVENGQLLARGAAEGFDALLTKDANLSGHHDEDGIIRRLAPFQDQCSKDSCLCRHYSGHTPRQD